MAAPTKLPESEIQRRLATLATWKLREGRLHRELQFRDFNAAFAFMASVALKAEKLDHHPDWQNVYNRVQVDLWTHDANGITDKDFELASFIDLAAGRF